MKNYKLIKEYPGSPKLGCILELKEDNNYYPINQPGGWFSEKSHLIPFPEFWEKVVEKDYEILKLKLHGYKNIIDVKKGDIVDCKISEKGYLEWKTPKGTYDSYMDNTVTLKIFDIYSIKRLSDGEIFTIGDNIKHKYKNTYHKIKEITIQIHGIMLHYGYTGSGEVYLEYAKKQKQPLFTTEDGVDIFEGDEVTWLFRDELKIAGTRKANENMYTYLKYFSTKEKAEEYILLNKPCLSLMEIRDLVGEHETVGRLIYKMEKLVKEKLKV